MEPSYKAVILVLFCGLDTVFGDLCYTGGSFWKSKTIHCTNSCCGSNYNEYCCNDDANIDAIAGGVVGGLILLSIIGCVICCCQKSQRRPGQLVQPMGGTTVVMSTQNSYGMAPQPYQPGPPAPAYGSNPAYPPPYPGNSNNAPPPPPKY